MIVEIECANSDLRCQSLPSRQDLTDSGKTRRLKDSLELVLAGKFCTKSRSLPKAFLQILKLILRDLRLQVATSSKNLILTGSSGKILP